MSFHDCIVNLNWVSIVVIAVLSALIEVAISSQSQNKNKQEFMKELYKITDVKKDVELIRDFLIMEKEGK